MVRIRSTLIIAALLLLLVQCAVMHRGGARVRIKGSDTMAVLTQRWAEAFMKRYPHIAVHAEAGGTQTGIQALTDGDADICAASRPILPDESKLLGRRYGKIGVEYLIGKDALIIYLHPQNPVQNLTLAQLKDIFTGKIRNWQMVGGVDAEIQLLSRPPQSGSYHYFREHVLDGQAIASWATILPTTRTIVQHVSEHPYAIGYGGVGFLTSVKACRIDGIEPIEMHLRNDTYPISRYLYLYTIDKPEGSVKLFIDWVMSAEGQQVVREAGFLPLWLK